MTLSQHSIASNTDIPNVLTIAGSDSSAGAGIQADLKTFAAHKTYGTSVITAITAQNTCRIDAIHMLPPKIIEAQIRAVFEDIEIKAVKIGMLGSEENIELVAHLLDQYKASNIVIDPVMISKSGNHLLEPSAIKALKEQLFPLSTLITPNIPEAACLLNKSEATCAEEMNSSLIEFCNFGLESVLLKGGHMKGELCRDILRHEATTYTFEHTKKHTPNTHGTGCTLSSAITALLAWGVSLPDAVKLACEYVHQSIQDDSNNRFNLKVGNGYGPLSHLRHWWE